jgi:hypothetical protein
VLRVVERTLDRHNQANIGLFNQIELAGTMLILRNGRSAYSHGKTVPETICANRSRKTQRGQGSARAVGSPLIAKGADEKLAQPFSDMVSAQIAKMRGIAGANVAKITASEMRHFLSFLRLEVRIELGLSGSDDEASSPDLPSPHLAK